ncbi:MAG: peroxiredoxin [Thermoplasmata archaeon]
MLAPGDLAPDFDGTTSTGGHFKLSEERGHPVVVYFFPRADTPGCTLEAKGFQAHLSELTDRDVRVVGVSTDPVEEERKFAEKYALHFPLVGDPDRAISARYGVLGPGGSARRVSFLIGPDGRVRQVVEGTPESHVSAACARDWSPA